MVAEPRRALNDRAARRRRGPRTPPDLGPDHLKDAPDDFSDLRADRAPAVGRGGRGAPPRGRAGLGRPG